MGPLATNLKFQFSLLKSMHFVLMLVMRNLIVHEGNIPSLNSHQRTGLDSLIVLGNERLNTGSV